jgi:restriction system protein
MPHVLDCLRALGGSARAREVSEWIADRLKLSDEKRQETQKKGVNRFYNQVAWARQYLIWEGLLESSKRGVWALTEKGLATHLSESQSREIMQKWVRFHAKAKEDEDKHAPAETADPVFPAEETSDDELLEMLLSVTPSGFEQICQRLLRESGFQKVTVTGKSHDGGIDGIGILQVNPFVSFKVLFQCKRYRGSVPRAHVGDFRNAMIGRADKGIIITTGTFSPDAIGEAERDGAPPVELVDGNKLVSMFTELELGLKPRTIYEVDHSFFAPFLPPAVAKNVS